MYVCIAISKPYSHSIVFDLSISVFSSGLLSSVLNLSFTHLSLTFLRNKPHEKSVSRDFEILCKGKKIPKILCKIPTGTLRRSLRHSQIRANWDVFAPSKSTLSTRLMSTVLL